MTEASEWFKKGQESVLRKNESGCVCKLDDDGNVVSACEAHMEWLEGKIKEICTSDNRPPNCFQDRPECELGPSMDGKRKCKGYLWKKQT